MHADLGELGPVTLAWSIEACPLDQLIVLSLVGDALYYLDEHIPVDRLVQHSYGTDLEDEMRHCYVGDHSILLVVHVALLESRYSLMVEMTYHAVLAHRKGHITGCSGVLVQRSLLNS